MTVPVTVVIPTYNSAATIGRAIVSVFRQSELPAEIIVVDDCSSDDTTNLVHSYGKQFHQEIQVIQLQANSGPSVARNVGWNKSTSDLIAFLDSDDSWHPEKLAIQAKWMLEHPEYEISGHLTSSTSHFADLSKWHVRFFCLHDFLFKNRISTPTVMLRRSLSERFDESSRYAEDYDLWLRILTRDRMVARLEVQLACLHKPDYGDSGLSSHLHSMFTGEIKSVRSLRKNRHISSTCSALAQLWMGIRYFRRRIVIYSREET